MPLPFDGAISEFYRTGAPDDIRRAIDAGGKKDMLTESYPYDAILAGRRQGHRQACCGGV